MKSGKLNEISKMIHEQKANIKGIENKKPNTNSAAE